MTSLFKYLKDGNQSYKLLYTSEHNYILIENIEFKNKRFRNLYDLIDACLTKKVDNQHIEYDLYNIIDFHLSKRSGLVLKIYPFSVNEVGYCLIDDLEFYKTLQNSDSSAIHRAVNSYISKCILNSGYKNGISCARINKGKYEKYECTLFFFDEEEFPPKNS